MAEQERLAALVEALADGTAVDWATAESTAKTEWERAVVRRLRRIEQVAALQRRAHARADASASGRDTVGETRHVEAWGHLQLVERIGHGAFGEVFRARDPRLARDVALKLLYEPASVIGARASAAIEEGRLLARVRHQNVVTVHGADRIDGRVGVWMEFIRGRTLEQVVREQGPLGPDDAARIGLDLCHALAAVHQAGLVHRDVKAQNVMREGEGRVVLMDFGAGHDPAEPANDRQLTGTPLYLAPEIFRGARATAQSDLYSLGVLLYHLVTGSYPIAARTLAEVDAAHRLNQRARLDDVRPDLPVGFVQVVERALAVDPEIRYSTAGDMATSLAEALAPERDAAVLPASTPLAGPDQNASTPQHHRWKTWAVAAAILVIASGVLGTVAWMGAGSSRAVDPGESLLTPTVDAAAGSATRLYGLEHYVLIGRPSHDGRYLPYVDGSGDVWIWETRQGTSRRVTDLGAAGEQAEFSLMSPDGGRLAYTVFTGRGAYELRVVDTGGGQPKVLLPSEAASYPRLLEWSRDGRQILCALEQSDGTIRLTLVHDRGGARVLVTFRQGAPKQASLSPDGQLLVYDQPKHAQSAKRDVLIARTDGSPPRVLVGGSANNLMPVWTPDGAGVFFVSDRSGPMDGWVVPVTGGIARGEPIHVASHLSRVSPLGLTADGRFYFSLQTNYQDVYTVEIDGGSANPATKARISPTVIGGHIAPGWSPNGEFISYITAGGNTALDRGSNTLTIQDARTGRTREIPLPLSRLAVMSPRWSPDGRSLFVRGVGLDELPGYFQVDLAAGTATRLLSWDVSRIGEYGMFAWSPDGRRILYLHQPRGIVSRDLGSGAEVVLVPRGASAPRWSIVVSPDGTRMAFSVTRQGKNALEISGLDGERRREVIAFDAPTGAVVQAWTPDGRALLYTTFTMNSDLPSRLSRIDLSGGAAHDMGLAVEGNTQVNKMALSPDGRRLAYTEGVVSWKAWMMDNFLPDLSARMSRP